MVDAALARAVAILTRAPSSGGKTRLFQELGLPPDPRLLSALLLDTVDAVSAVDAQRRVFVTPDSECDEVRRLTRGDVLVAPQGEGDLGARMGGALTRMFDEGAGLAVLIGSDLPHIAPALMEGAFSRLVADPGSIVLGPSSDGGYYLVGAAAVPPIFEGPAWGGKGVLADTLKLIHGAGLRAQLLEELDDVDSIATLRAAITTGLAPRTAEWWRLHHLSA